MTSKLWQRSGGASWAESEVRFDDLNQLVYETPTWRSPAA